MCQRKARTRYQAEDVYICHMKSESILIRNGGPGSPWLQPDTTAYEHEEHLETLLADEPHRIPHVPPNSRSVQQLSTIHGPLDICVVGSDGSITVVECKLAKNSEHRRQKIGQPIDYAAAIHARGFQSFVEEWKSRGGESFESFLEPGALQRLEDNINSGALNLCLAVDRIDDDLRRLVEYLNIITKDDVGVTALEIAYVKQGNIEILIPTTFGTEIVRAKTSRRNGVTEYWKWEEFLEQLSSESDREIATDLMNRLKSPNYPKNKIWCGTKPGGGIQFYIFGEDFPAFYLWMNSAKRLNVFGAWRLFSKSSNDESFKELATLLGQDHLGGASGVLLESLNLDLFWEAAERCERQLNKIL